MFKVGDIVEAWGVRGVVVKAGEEITVVELELDERYYTTRHTFLKDGRSEEWHLEPTLKLIERPKKRVKKVLYPAVRKVERSSGSGYHYVLTNGLYENLEDAKKTGLNVNVVGLGPAIEIEVESE